MKLIKLSLEMLHLMVKNLYVGLNKQYDPHRSSGLQDFYFSFLSECIHCSDAISNLNKVINIFFWYTHVPA